ncbi:E3 ubiquitin-protein ligase BAH1-like isoform X2 [Salvia splendens]|uniref:E3 ubiquitin-protein ligase BAH1-like isoform X2 n=1 Tax=Salvia splendens TaxID=180675 RepID=UPI001C277CC1|nr:E3 ubiquitin-protein ligase BAH1-like isoform X2 [Salvia splendens]
MKFCNEYDEMMQGLGQKKLPRIDFGSLNNILESCRKQLLHSHTADVRDDQANADGVSADSQLCSVCEGTFFPTLLKEIRGVVGFFNSRAQALLDRHLPSGCCKCFLWLGDRLLGTDVELIQECETLIAYATINTIAVRRLLKKYDKIHYSKQGQAFKSRAVSMRVEILQSPWLYELMALHINLREAKANMECAHLQLDGFSLIFDNTKPSLSFELFDSIKLNIELTCSICLTLFDPVSLGCGHLFCYMCACKASSVSVVDGLKAASGRKKCPVCREVGIYESAVNLEELHILLKRSWPEYWEERRKMEKAERIEEAKQHWQSQAARFMGI